MSTETQVVTIEEQREQLLVSALEQLKKRAGEAINEVMADLYSGYLPYVADDTESNIAFRVQGCITNLIAGKFEPQNGINGSCHVLVSDNYGVRHLISLNSWSDMIKPLCEAMGAEIQNARIHQLTRQVEDLQAQLAAAWRAH
ncbi:hypothetical protein [Metapseudomonas sp. CR1201]